MDHEIDMPDWVVELAEDLASSIELQGWCEFETRFYPTSNPNEEVDELQLAPEKMEIAERGSSDGSVTFVGLYNADLLAIQEAFDGLGHFALSFDTKGAPSIVMEGTVEGHDISVEIFSTPFEDGIVRTVVEGGRTRDKL